MEISALGVARGSYTLPSLGVILHFLQLLDVVNQYLIWFEYFDVLTRQQYQGVIFHAVANGFFQRLGSDDDAFIEDM